MFSNIRVRLTLWYVLSFGTLLIAFSTYLYSSVSAEMRRRFDSALLRTAHTMATHFKRIVESGDVAAVAKETIQQLAEGREGVAFYGGGRLLFASDTDVTRAIESTGILKAGRATSDPAFATVRLAVPERLVVVPFDARGVQHAIAVLEPLDKIEGQIGHMRNIILFALPAALALSAAGGFLLARKSLQPVMMISNQAANISASNLNERLEAANPGDELGQLTGVFNNLLSRLEASFRVAREFMANASHELKTPITIIQGEAEVALAQDRTAGEYRESLAIVRTQSKRMARIVTDMLTLARADAREHLRVQEFYLNDLVEECCWAAQGLAAANGIQLTCRTGADMAFQGDEELLKSMTVNLVDNGIRYTAPGGSVTVSLTREDSYARLEVSDTGVGIPEESLGRVFDRFYRVEDSRARHNGGSGLGLSIVKLAADAHKGSVDVVSTIGVGSKFMVVLPLA
jgi:heavy metal sensor kinase